MLSGRRLDLADPSPLDIEIEDIAHGLARVARWNGQTIGDHAFSVAQHCLLVVDLVDVLFEQETPADLRLAALLHDGPEYVIGDMISPFKALLGDGYRSIEARLAAAIHLRHQLPASLPVPMHKLIKQADSVSAFLEASQLAGFALDEAEKLFGKPPGSLATITLQPMSALDAETAFLTRHGDLFAAHLAHLAVRPKPPTART
ncbi:MAG: HD family hydrolase [Rhizobiales bacterium]|nr:HD family hydrolase [Hyphomicrobiales bacterium]MBO6700421.1 HD family hydrolase [Hyphomicrobiales bacterium]MBO6737957.1 HD family hydrolase [Hyphomicrobiales bacterium]MBO6913736.1 HD family hydrolase [Hyphomicrobiales bacterium]MBO6954369.1 HD family hydrolase [Hyphomicrobiales bacterium]